MLRHNEILLDIWSLFRNLCSISIEIQGACRTRLYGKVHTMLQYLTLNVLYSNNTYTNDGHFTLQPRGRRMSLSRAGMTVEIAGGIRGADRDSDDRHSAGSPISRFSEITRRIGDEQASCEKHRTVFRITVSASWLSVYKVMAELGSRDREHSWLSNLALGDDRLWVLCYCVHEQSYDFLDIKNHP